MIGRRKVAVLVLLTWAGAFSAEAASAYYVSPSGSDSNPGTLAAPFQTLDHARQIVGAVSGTATGDITVYLEGGLYQMTAPVVFTGADSGQNGHRIIYQAMAGQTPVLSGGLIVSNWTLHDTAKNIWQASVPAGTTFRQLYVNGVKANLARSANNLGLVQTSTGYSSTNSQVTSLAASPSLDTLEVASWTHSWDLEILPVASVTGSGAVTLHQPALGLVAAGAYPGYNNAEWLENAYEFLANPGDWYLQPATNTVYYIPRSGDNMATATVEAPVLRQLIALSGTSTSPVSNLAFEGLTFEMTTWPLAGTGLGTVSAQANQPFVNSPVTNMPTRWSVAAAVDGSYMQNVDVTQCVFSNLGGDGVNVGDGSTNDAIDHCLFHDLSASAIQVSQGWYPLASLSSTDPAIVDGIVVANNTIHDVCTDYPSGTGIYVGWTRNCSILHNHLYNLPYTGISLGWGWTVASNSYATNNFIDGNLVHGQLTVPYQGLDMADGGAIYCNGYQQHATLSENYVYDQGGPYGELYLDDGGSDWSVFNNVAPLDGGSAWYLYKGSNNHAYNNYSNSSYVMNLTTGPLPSTCANNTIVTGGNWPPAAQALISAAGPSGRAYYSSGKSSILLSATAGAGAFAQGLAGWTVGGPSASQAGVVAGAYSDSNTPAGTACVAFTHESTPPGATLSTAFPEQAGHTYALSYSQAAMGGTNYQTLQADIIETNSNDISLGISITWVESTYSRYLRTFQATASGSATLQFTDATSGSNAAGTDCTLEWVELRDVTPPVSTQSGTAGVWNSPVGGNWDGSIQDWLSNPPSSGDIADFSEEDITNTVAVTLEGPKTVAGLIFGDPNTESAAGWILSSGAGDAYNNLTLTSGTVTVQALGSGQSATIGAVLTGTGGIVKQGLGTLVLTGNNTYTGGTIVNSGTLTLGAQSNAGTGIIVGDLTINSAGYLNANTDWSLGYVTAVSAITINGGALNFYGSANGGGTAAASIAMTGGTISGTAFDWYSAGTGNYTVTTNASGTPAVISSGFNLRVTNAGSVTFNVAQGSGSPDLLVSGVIANGSGSGAGNAGGNLVKTGSGVMVLAAANTYTGSTTVSGGTLEVDGAIASSSSVAVGAGATLSGSGTAPRVTVGNGGTLAPGVAATPGTLNTGSLSLNSGGSILFRLGTPSNQVKVSGSLVLNGAINLVDTGSATSGTYTLFTYSGSLSGTPTVVAPSGFSATLNASSPGVVSVTLTANSFSTWERSYFTAAQIANPLISGPTASPSGDGVSNLLKYALGLSSNLPITPPGPLLQQSGTAWTLTYQRPANRPDITYLVEVSTDLATWTSSGVTQSEIASGDPQTWQGIYAPGAAPKLFFRLQISQP